MLDGETALKVMKANYNPNHKDNQGKLTRKEELSKVVESSEKIAAIMDELPGGFGKTLKYHMERLDINEEELRYSLIDVDKVTTAYLEAGGVYPNYKYNEDIDKVEKSMKASGYTCNRYK